jgi:hypothetical protein
MTYFSKEAGMTFSILSDPQPPSGTSRQSSGIAVLKVDQQLSISEDLAGNDRQIV